MINLQLGNLHFKINLPKLLLFRIKCSFTYHNAIGEGYGCWIMVKSDVEYCFHCRFIKARESFPGICWLHLGCGDNSKKEQGDLTIHERPFVE